MSVALIIRNINPDCDKNTQLVVVTVGDNNIVASEMGLAPYPNTSTTFHASGQVYWLPYSQSTLNNAVFLNDQHNHCNEQSSTEPDYLWFCELDQAG
ncbi:hypothetical protein ACF3NA_07230 [Alkanindiges sp. WGS2144]|uniref:hypothetical protein n=1 Tax=Alkanindiges sp. WGS2144 TaxID=3366808 RepID=UPI0037505EC0